MISLREIIVLISQTTFINSGGTIVLTCDSDYDYVSLLWVFGVDKSKRLSSGEIFTASIARKFGTVTKINFVTVAARIPSWRSSGCRCRGCWCWKITCIYIRNHFYWKVFLLLIVVLLVEEDDGGIVELVLDDWVDVTGEVVFDGLKTSGMVIPTIKHEKPRMRKTQAILFLFIFQFLWNDPRKCLVLIL